MLLFIMKKAKMSIKNLLYNRLVNSKNETSKKYYYCYTLEEKIFGCHFYICILIFIEVDINLSYQDLLFFICLCKCIFSTIFLNKTALMVSLKSYTSFVK